MQCVWPALNPLSIHVFKWHTAIVPEAYPWRPKCALGWLQTLTHVPLVIAILLVFIHKHLLTYPGLSMTIEVQLSCNGWHSLPATRCCWLSAPHLAPAPDWRWTLRASHEGRPRRLQRLPSAADARVQTLQSLFVRPLINATGLRASWPAISWQIYVASCSHQYVTREFFCTDCTFCTDFNPRHFEQSVFIIHSFKSDKDP